MSSKENSGWNADHYTHPSITHSQADALGIPTLLHRRRECSLDRSYESPFGQSEELTTRLRGILKDYSNKTDAFKELIQNADDAGATEIHIVYDARTHATKGVDKNWAPMHTGHSICVYNNSSFTDEDIDGIQSVGVGGKLKDTATIGRYGIGFNAVYHLTDCPTFVTQKCSKLCIFDPHQKYNSRDKPGNMYHLQGPNGYLAICPNIIDGYLREFDEFNLQEGTVFRFPLRMYGSGSKLSDEYYTEKDVHALLRNLKGIVKKSLMFLKHIRKISISTIDTKTGKIKSNYWIGSNISEKDQEKRIMLNTHLRSHMNTSGLDIPPKNCVFQMVLKDAVDTKETWLISENIGTAVSDKTFEESKTFMSKKTLPRGGVAALIDVQRNPSPLNCDNPYQRSFNAYCFLPLQVTTKLPVHANGDFFLDQSRKGLAKGKEYTADKSKTDDNIHIWNRLLVKQVLVPAYAELIKFAGRHLLDTNKKDFHMRQRLYDNIFPIDVETLSGEWNLLAKDTLSYIGHSNLEVLPVVRTLGRERQHIEVTWHHPNSHQSDAFFDDLPLNDGYKDEHVEIPNRLRQYLIRTGFRLLSSRNTICQAFQESGVDACFVSAYPVKQHLLAIGAFDDSYQRPISTTPFQNSKILQRVLTYCLKANKEDLKYIYPHYLGGDKEAKKREKEIIDKVNCDVFIDELARQIEKSATAEGDIHAYDYLIHMSKVLVEQLENNYSFYNPNFLKFIADIKFIPKHPVEDELRRIHEPVGKSKENSVGPFISYRGSVPENYKNEAWSAANILPDWSVPSKHKMIHNVNVHSCLGIELCDIFGNVLGHIQNVFRRIAKRRYEGDSMESTNAEMREKTREIMCRLLKFLDEHLNKYNKKINNSLQNTQICPVQEDTKLVRACKVVLHMTTTAEKELRPFLYQPSRNYAQYCEVFRSLGAKEEITISILAEILGSIRQECEEKNHEMVDMTKRTAHAATRYMFQKLLDEEPFPEDVTELYLPTSKGKLKLSSDLYYVDINRSTSIDLESTDLEFVVPLEQYGFGDNVREEDVFNLLPENLRPRDLCTKMKERPCETNKLCPYGKDCPFVHQVENVITSQPMQKVLLRLVQHQSSHKEPTEELKSNIATLLEFANITCVFGLQTGLFDDDGKMMCRKKVRKVFLFKQENDELVLYLDHRDPELTGNSLHYRELARNINTMCKLDLDDCHVSYLREVVACSDLNNMDKMLGDLGIPEYEYGKETGDEPIPGSAVSEDLWNFLDDDMPMAFYPGESAVLKRPDHNASSSDSLAGSEKQDLDDRDGQCTNSSTVNYVYIYCKILQTIKADNQEFGHKYIIDIGETDGILKSDIWLYRFRQELRASKSSDDNHDSQHETFRTDKYKVQISEQIMAASAMSEQDQLQCIKRLFRKWHLTQNSQGEGDEFNPVEYLESQIKHQIEDKTLSCYSTFYSQWRDELSSQDATLRCDSTPIPSAMIRRAPNHRKADLWLSQAKEDYNTAMACYQKGVYTSLAWLAFMLQQAVEKALKAAIFSIEDIHCIISHDLSWLCSYMREKDDSVQIEALEDDVIAMVRLQCHAIKPRYPEGGSYETTGKIYANFEVQKALKHCEIILEQIGAIILSQRS